MRLARSQTARYGLGYATSVGSRLLRDLMLARTLGAGEFGLWTGLSVLRQYSAFSDLGVTNGLGRLLPRTLREEGRPAGGTLMGMAWIGAMGSTALFALVLMVWALPRQGPGQTTLAWGVITIVVLMFLEKHQMYSSVVFASVQRVGDSGLFMGQLGLTELLLSLLLAGTWGLYGLYVGLLGSMLVTLTMMYMWQPLRGTFKWERERVRPLLTTSFVLLGYGLANIAVHNVDRIAIIFQRGAGMELGHYHIASIFSLAVGVLPYIVASVLVPQIYRFGAQHGAELRRYLLLPTAVTGVLAVIAATLVWLIVPPLLRSYLPRFGAAAQVLAPLLLAEVWFSVAIVPSSVLVALDRGIGGFIVRLAVVALAFGGSWIVLAQGGSLGGVGWVMAIAHGCGTFAIGILATRRLSVSFARFLLVAGAPLAYGLLVQVGLQAAFGEADTTGELVAHLALSLALLLPLLTIPLAYIGKGPLTRPWIMKFLDWERAS